MLDKARLKKLADYFKNQPVDLVYLFGSQATGKNTKLSDIDIAVLFKDSISKSRRFDLRCRFIADLMGVLKTEKLDVINFREASVALKYSVIAPKYEIYIADNKKRAVLEAEITSKYLDQQYFIQQNTAVGLASISKMKIGG